MGTELIGGYAAGTLERLNEVIEKGLGPGSECMSHRVGEPVFLPFEENGGAGRISRQYLIQPSFGNSGFALLQKVS
jgi:hypothetical protein